jgi:uncharacterized protein (DUF302 family)
MNNETSNSEANEIQKNEFKTKKNSAPGAFAFGLILGIIITAIVGWLSMPGMMITVHQSRYNTVEETCKQLKSSIVANNWQCPGVRNLNKAMGKHGVTMKEQVRIVELCNAQYAKDVLLTNPEILTLMPCAWGVYKGKDGKVYISGMNMGLMGKMFGGNIAKVMGGTVSKDEQAILKNVIQK